MPDETKAVRPSQLKAQAEDWGRAAMDGNQQAVARWTQALFALTQEIAGFTQHRLQEDMTAWFALTSCRSPEQAVECQQRFVAKATQEYSDEIAKLTHLMSDLRWDALSAPQRAKPNM